jgi:hypothetical protein
LRASSATILRVVAEHDARQAVAERAHQLVEIRLLDVFADALRQTFRPRQVEVDAEPHAVEQ